jgi:hypothetical protein
VREYLRLGLLGVGIVAALLGLAVFANLKDDDTDKRYSPLEAACKMLDDGDTPDQAYALLVDLLGEHEYQVPNPRATARASVDRAVAGDC